MPNLIKHVEMSSIFLKSLTWNQSSWEPTKQLRTNSKLNPKLVKTMFQKLNSDTSYSILDSIMSIGLLSIKLTQMMTDVSANKSLLKLSQSWKSGEFKSPIQLLLLKKSTETMEVWYFSYNFVNGQLRKILILMKTMMLFDYLIYVLLFIYFIYSNFHLFNLRKVYHLYA